MQHSIGGGAPWPGLVIGAAVYPKIPQQIQITGQQARILQGQVSDQRRGPPLPGISALRQHRDAAAGLRKTSTSTSPIIASIAAELRASPRHTRVQEIGQHLRGLVHHTRNDAIRPVSPRRQRLN